MLDLNFPLFEWKVINLKYQLCFSLQSTAGFAIYFKTCCLFRCSPTRKTYLYATHCGYQQVMFQQHLQDICENGTSQLQRLSKYVCWIYKQLHNPREVRVVMVLNVCTNIHNTKQYQTNPPPLGQARILSLFVHHSTLWRWSNFIQLDLFIYLFI